MEKIKEIKNKKVAVTNSTILIILILFMSTIFIINSFNKVNADQPYRIPESVLKEMFNNKFLGHTGNVSTASVKALANAIIVNNTTNPEQKVKFNGIDDAKIIGDTIKEYFDMKERYIVEAKYNNDTGYITDILVSKYDFNDIYYDLDNISEEMDNLEIIISIMFGINIFLVFIVLVLVIKSNKKIKV